MRTVGWKIIVFTTLLAATAAPFGALADSRIPIAPGQSEDITNIPTKQKEVYLPIDSQSDAYKTASEASSYLGFYMMNYGHYGKETLKQNPKRLAETQRAISLCLNGSSECTDTMKVQVLNAIVNYNLGKEVRRHILQNSTNYENIKSMPGSLAVPGLAKDRKTRISGPFKLREQDISNATTFVLDGKKQREREILGPVFMNEYRAFIDSYTSTTPDREHWHYVAQRVPGKTGSDSSYVLASDKFGRTVIDTARFDDDQIAQRHDVVREKVKELKQQITQPKLMQLSADRYEAQSDIRKDLRTTQLGLDITKMKDEKTDRVLDDSEAGVVIVRNLNKAVDQVAQDARKNSLPGQNVIVGTTINLDAFTNYLDEIWPPAAKRAAILNKKPNG